MPTPKALEVVAHEDGFVIEAEWHDGSTERLIGLFDTERAARNWISGDGYVRWLRSKAGESEE